MSTEAPTPGFLIWRLSMRLRVALDRTLAPLGLTHAQYSVLATLYGLSRNHISPTQKELADHTGLEPLYVSKLARALESTGFVERTTDPADSRAVRLALTTTGRTTTRRAITIVHELQVRLMAPLGGLDSKRANAFLRDLKVLLDTPLEVAGGGDRNGE
jgi:DNA-binding MarR family transcriptional regulator